MLPTSRNALRCVFQRWIVIVLLLATLPVANVRTGAMGTVYTATTVAALIADINAANAAQGQSTINLMPGGLYTLTTEATLNSGTGLPAIMSGVDLTIAGNGATIQRSTAGGTPDFRIFVNGSGATLRLNALAVRNGSVVGAAGASGTVGTGSPAAAGGSAVGGALFNSGTLTVSGSTFANNHAVGGAGGTGGSGHDNNVTPGGTGGAGGDGGGASGGAISNIGKLVVTGSTFSTNSVLGGAGGTGGNGGNGSGAGIGGNAGKGGDTTGGALNNSGMMTVINSTFVGNTTIGGAGGNGGNPGMGTSGSTAGYGASGGMGQGGAISGMLALTNSTITANSAVGGAGGTGFGGKVADASGSGGGLRTPGGGATAKNVILAANIATSDGNCGNFVTDGGNNIDFNQATTCGFTNARTGNPQLGALANNGGPTQTIALGMGSAAINNGDPMACAGTAGGVDQRGLPRPAGQCSIGAFEPQAPPTLTAMSPTSGPIAGGSSVTLIGAGFLPGATVTFGPNPAITVTVINRMTITVTTPAHSGGTVSVAVTNPDLQVTAAMLYTYGTISTSPAARLTNVPITGSPSPLPGRRPPGASSGGGSPNPLPPHR